MIWYTKYGNRLFYCEKQTILHLVLNIAINEDYLGLNNNIDADHSLTSSKRR